MQAWAGVRWRILIMVMRRRVRERFSIGVEMRENNEMRASCDRRICVDKRHWRLRASVHTSYGSLMSVVRMRMAMKRRHWRVSPCACILRIRNASSSPIAEPASLSPLQTLYSKSNVRVLLLCLRSNLEIHRGLLTYTPNPLLHSTAVSSELRRLKRR